MAFWTTEEIEFLQKNYSLENKEMLVKYLDRNWDTIVQRACLLKVGFRRWTEKEKNELRKRYAKEGCSIALQKRFMLSPKSLAGAAFRYGAKRNDSKREWASCYKGYGEMYGAYFSGVRTNARERGLIFKITPKHVWNLFLKQNRRCALSGIILKFSHNCRNLSDQTASLDRIDSLKGYVKGNLQWVHKDLNRMKWQISQRQFIKYCKLVTKYNK